MTIFHSILFCSTSIEGQILEYFQIIQQYICFHLLRKSFHNHDCETSEIYYTIRKGPISLMLEISRLYSNSIFTNSNGDVEGESKPYLLAVCFGSTFPSPNVSREKVH